MKEELLNNIVDITNYVKQGGEFVKSQAPDFIQQYINYHLVSDILLVIILPIIIITCIFLCRKFVKAIKECSLDQEFFYMMGTIISIVIMIMAAIFTIIGLVEIVQIIIAPKVFIVHSLLGLIK